MDLNINLESGKEPKVVTKRPAVAEIMVHRWVGALIRMKVENVFSARHFVVDIFYRS